MVVEIKKISKTFYTEKGSVYAIKDINLSLNPGEIVTLIGPSGCGKTTLLRIIAGLEEQSTGNVDISDSGAKKDIAFVFQDPALLPWRTALQNVRLALELNKAHKSKKREDLDEVSKKMLGEVGLYDMRSLLPYQLSGGMKHRVAVARAFVSIPKIILMDEPFGSLDTITRESIQRLLLRIWNIYKPTIIFVTHDINEAVFISDRIVVLSDAPSVIKNTFKISLKRPRLDEIRISSNFISYSQSIKEKFSK